MSTKDVTICNDFAHYIAAHVAVMAERSPRLNDMTLYLVGRKIVARADGEEGPGIEIGKPADYDPASLADEIAEAIAKDVAGS